CGPPSSPPGPSETSRHLRRRAGRRRSGRDASTGRKRGAKTSRYDDEERGPARRLKPRVETLGYVPLPLRGNGRCRGAGGIAPEGHRRIAQGFNPGSVRARREWDPMKTRKRSLWTRAGLSWWDLLVRLWRQLREDEVPGRCAELSYYFL